MFDEREIKKFDWSDLVGTTLTFRSFQDGNVELIVGKEKTTGTLYLIKEIIHPAEPKA